MGSSEFLQRTRRSGDGLRIAAALACASWLAGGCAYLLQPPGSQESGSQQSGSQPQASEDALAAQGGEQREDPTQPAEARPSAKTSQEPGPAAPARLEPPSPSYIQSDLLEIERSGGEPVAVLLEAGVGEGLRRGMEGDLVDRGRVIGKLEIIAVYDFGSRARIVGELSVPITFETAARIRN